MSKPVIHCLGFFPDYEAMFFNQVQSDRFDVVVFNLSQMTDQVSWFKRLPRFFRNVWHKAIIKKYLASNTTAVVVMNEHRLGLQALYDFLTSSIDSNTHLNIHILLRNPFDPSGKIATLLPSLMKLGVSVWSFDHRDCVKFGFLFYPQFVERIEGLNNTQIQYDFSFVGRDKGRAELLNRLKKDLDGQGYSTRFDIRDPASSDIAQSENLSYVEYLERYLSAKCMVEILQEGQSGMTLRPLEALVYGRKLLTNNPDVVKEDFYHPNNILVMDATGVDLKKLEIFMLQPFMRLQDVVSTRYTATGVLNMVFDKKTSVSV